MKNGISASVCLFLQLVLATTADKEYADTKERHYQEGMHNVEFDHEAILGSLDGDDDFSKISAHEAKRKLAVLLSKMDTSGDGYISKKEISDWVLASFRKQDEKEALEKLKEVDANSDGQMSWGEYLKKVYGYTVEELDVFKKDLSPDMQSFIRMVRDDEDKFVLTDRDRNGFLSQEEHAAFLFPGDYEFMHEHEVSRTLIDLDKDNDGTISFEEYMGESKPGKEQLIVDQENFNSYDTDNNGKLDRQEIRSWTLPDRRSMSDEEAEHLLQETDLNKDGRLSFDEVLDRHDLWVGSAATEYGQSLRHDPAEL